MCPLICLNSTFSSPVNVLCKMKLTRRSCWSMIWLPIPHKHFWAARSRYVSCACALMTQEGNLQLEPSSPVSFLSLHVANGLAQAVIVSFCSAPVFSAYIVFVARAATYDANVRCRSSTKPGTGKQNTATQHTRMAANCACCLPCHLPGFMP